MGDELSERMRTWRKAHPRATMYEIEKELDDQIAAMRARLLTETITSERGDGDEATVCPVCGAKMAKDGLRKRKLKTTGNQEIEFVRQYMRCPQCGYGFFPPG